MRRHSPLLLYSSALFVLCLATNAASAASLTVSDDRPHQGETIQVKLKEAGESSTAGHSLVFKAASPKSTYKEKTLKMFPSPGEEWEALLAIPADLDPGKYVLESGEAKQQLLVSAGKFPLQYLRLPPGKDNFDTSPGEEEAVDKAKATVTDERMWTAPFTPPVKARMSTGFGLKRSVNGKILKDYFHSGLDYAAGMGTPIKATAPGKIILAGHGWKLHGNCLAIDHGQGVVSFYIHLSKILVKQGQMVKQGEVIGKVGATGRANGPHLHFSIYVNSDASNPMQWYKESFQPKPLGAVRGAGMYPDVVAPGALSEEPPRTHRMLVPPVDFAPKEPYKYEDSSQPHYGIRHPFPADAVPREWMKK